jgi:hypothetical protein
MRFIYRHLPEEPDIIAGSSFEKQNDCGRYRRRRSWPITVLYWHSPGITDETRDNISKNND